MLCPLLALALSLAGEGGPLGGSRDPFGVSGVPLGVSGDSFGVSGDPSRVNRDTLGVSGDASGGAGTPLG